MHDVHTGVEQFVRRVGPSVQPASVSRMRASSSSGVTRSLPGGSSQSRRHTPSGGASGDLRRRGSGRPPRRHPMQQRLVGPRKFRAQRGHGVSLHRRTAGEADVEEFADGRARAVAAHQVTAAPPDAVGAAGVRGDARGLLLDRVQAVVRGDLHQPFGREGLAEGAGQDVLGDVQGAGSVSSKVISRVTCLRRIDRHPAQRVPAPPSGAPVSRSRSAVVSSRRTTVRARRGSSLPGPRRGRRRAPPAAPVPGRA